MSVRICSLYRGIRDVEWEAAGSQFSAKTQKPKKKKLDPLRESIADYVN